MRARDSLVSCVPIRIRLFFPGLLLYICRLILTQAVANQPFRKAILLILFTIYLTSSVALIKVVQLSSFFGPRILFLAGTMGQEAPSPGIIF